MRLIFFYMPAECENGLFAAVCCLSGIYSGKKEKATTENARLSPCVAFTYKISNRFIEDFERIMDFVEYNHITL